MPAAVVTVTSTVAAVPAGAMAVIDVAEFTTNDVAVALPKATVMTLTKLAPVMLTDVEPPVGPLVVARLVTVGKLAAAV